MVIFYNYINFNIICAINYVILNKKKFFYVLIANFLLDHGNVCVNNFLYLKTVIMIIGLF